MQWFVGSLKSARYALTGFIAAIRSERSVRWHLLVGTLTMAAALVAGLDALHVDWWSRG